MKSLLVLHRLEKHLEMKLWLDSLSLRMREFEQMEMQFFIKPGTQEKWYNHGKSTFKMAFISWPWRK